MKTHGTLLAICVMMCSLASTGSADEGMWMPHQIQDLDLEARGLEMDPEDIYRKDGTGLVNAVVIFGGGGTGEFVSSEGLILTNHHIAFDALQRESTADSDLLTDGFMAPTRAAEMPAKGYSVDVFLGYREVTEQIQAALTPNMSPDQRQNAIEQAQKQLVGDAEKEGRDIRAQVASMFSGNAYYLFRFKRISDIRLVYAPPQSLGRFGGEIDNWMWPRHSTDFAFMRAYVSPDNVGVEYSEDNVPYRPPSVLKISLDGFEDGDFAFIVGYPGYTYRNNTLAELRSDLTTLQRRSEGYRDVISFLEAAGRDDREIELRYANCVRALNNRVKNYGAKLEGIEKRGVIDLKAAQEEELSAWVAANDERRSQYGQALARIEDFMTGYEHQSLKIDLLEELVQPPACRTLLGQAYTIYRTVVESQKPDMDRDPEYQERNLPSIRTRIEVANQELDLATDLALLKHRLEMLSGYPADLVPATLRDLLDEGSADTIDRFVDALYEKTGLTDPGRRLELLNLDPQALLGRDDPLIGLAADLEREMQVLREAREALDQEREDLRKVYLAALLEKRQGQLAPDANVTIRFTSGAFEGYSPRDAVVYLSQTTLTGMIEKDEGEYPFLVPPALIELYRHKDFGRYLDEGVDDVPVCLLTSTLITGGNSGSPTFNAKGELVGVVFDMTYDGVITDYYDVPELRRTISVDIRNVLFLTEKLGGGKHIIEELGL